jgi:hypothetical protein
MATLPPPGVQFFPEDSLEKRLYKIVEGLKEYLPIPNDRNRMGFCLYKYMTGEGDPPEVLVKSTKIKIEGITAEKLAQHISEELVEISKK